jgi:predicted transcriptional regulator
VSSLVVKAVVVFAEEVENRGMATEYIGLPGELVEKVKEAAAREEITPEELVRDAVENRLSRAEWRKTVEFGHRNARERGLKPEDVDAEISAARAELSR